MLNNFLGNQSLNQSKKQNLKETKRKELPNLKFQKGNYNEVKPQIQNHLKNWNKYEQHSRQIEQLYEDLERDDSFIQWIFPNFFSSMFNSFSYRLTIEERNLILNDEQAQLNYVKNYQMYLRFLGIKVEDGQLILENQNQLKKCFCYNTHNLSRIQRVLASLSVLGRRSEALQLLDFMKEYEKINSSFSYKQFESYQITKEEFEQLKGKSEVQNKSIQQVEQQQINSSLRQAQLQSSITHKSNNKNDQKKQTKNVQTKTKLQNQQEQSQQNNQQGQNLKKELQKQIEVLGQQNQQNQEQQTISQHEFLNNKKKCTKVNQSVKIQSLNGDSDLSESEFQDFYQVYNQSIEKTCKIEWKEEVDDLKAKNCINKQIEKRNSDDELKDTHNLMNQQKQDEELLQNPEKNEFCQDVFEDGKKFENEGVEQFQSDFQQKNEIYNQSQNQVIEGKKQSYLQQKRYELFEKVKNYYVQRDLFKEEWVTAKLLTMELISNTRQI